MPAARPRCRRERRPPQRWRLSRPPLSCKVHAARRAASGAAQQRAWQAKSFLKRLAARRAASAQLSSLSCASARDARAAYPETVAACPRRRRQQALGNAAVRAVQACFSAAARAGGKVSRRAWPPAEAPAGGKRWFCAAPNRQPRRRWWVRGAAAEGRGIRVNA